MTALRRIPVRSLLVSCVVLLACRSTEPERTGVEAVTYADTLQVDLSRFERLPSGLFYRDSVPGTGAELVAGRQVGVHYVAYLPDARRVASVLPPAAPYRFRLGTGAVIRGWEEGLPGMRVGGKRQLLVPPELAYGAGYLVVPASTVLVFVVDAVESAPAP